MQRREFLIVSSMAATALSLASKAGVAMAASVSRYHPTWNAASVIVYDARYSLASELAHRQVASGARAFRAEECLVRLWRGPIAECLQHGATRIAGVTLYSDFLVARDCAREGRLAVLNEQWHREGQGTLVSWLIGAR